MIAEILLAPAQVIGKGSDIPTLVQCLLFALNNDHDGRIAHFKPIPEADRSIRLFGRYPFEGSVPFPKPVGPEELAGWLMKLSYARQTEDRARYLQGRNPCTTKGWTISRSSEFVDEQGHLLIAAYATWIES